MTADGKVVPQLAEDWTDDGKSLTLKLRDAAFASGNPVTANDVVFLLTRLMKLNQSGSSYFKRIDYSAETIVHQARCWCPCLEISCLRGPLRGR